MWHIVLEQFQGKTIAILGYGVEGKSTLRFIKEYVRGCTLLVADRNELLPQLLEQAEMSDVTPICGEDYLLQLSISQPDIVFKSPGVPMMTIDHLFTSAQITSQAQLFLLLLRERVVGITGTKGKTTTAHLLKTALTAGGADAVLVGNMGIPVLDELPMDHAHRLYVFEMSSHMLENLQVSPRYAVLLNIHEEHLDHYRCFHDYWRAKLNILLHQGKGDVALIGQQAVLFLQEQAQTDLQEILPKNCLTKDASGLLLHRGTLGELMIEPMPAFQIPALRILGRHNRDNASFAYAAAARMLHDFGIAWKQETVLTAMASFAGVPHRLEYVGLKRGIDWYNDSISTIPQAAIFAAEAVSNIKTLILGGMDRGIDYTELIRFIQTGAVDNLVMLPNTGHALLDRLNAEAANENPLPSNVTLYRVSHVEEAVQCAAAHTPVGFACVLSPAAASYGFFRNFEERGNCFKTAVSELENISGC